MLLRSVIFLPAFLLFQMQLIVAKHLLPWFGGTPAVWTTSQMFFQVLLLRGYAYAHRLGKVSRVSMQPRIHVALLLSSSVAVLADPPAISDRMPARPRCSSLPSHAAPQENADPKARGFPLTRQNGLEN